MRQRTSELEQRVAALVENTAAEKTRTIVLESIDSKRIRYLRVLITRMAEDLKLLEVLMDLTVQDLADLYKISDDEEAVISLAPDMQGQDAIVCFKKSAPPEKPEAPED